MIVTSGRAERNFRLRKSRLDEAWNLVKVTRRGPVASDELCRIRNDYRSFWISFR